MNSIEYINQLIQAVNSLNGQTFVLRSEIEQLKKEFGGVKDSLTIIDKQNSTEDYNKKNEEQVRVIIESMDKTKVMMEEMQKKLGSVEELYKRVAVDGDLDYFKVVSKETSEKLKNLEIALTLKTNTLERTLKNIPKPPTKEEIQSMIDASISILLQPTQLQQDHTSEPQLVQVQEPHTMVTLDNLQDHVEPVLSIELDDNSKQSLSESNEELEVSNVEPVQVVIQSVEPSVSSSKPKRKYNKKTK